ncbi:hypothetical protein [Tsukamurella sp. 1534]|uniref:hypothetical protein n=1 Tax=Tsukamurella sp. 1534 TaxID=1151061 RepID=UPI0011D1B3D7|nr:hypothetical protein [Tsukamurella sp. 1534]
MTVLAGMVQARANIRIESQKLTTQERLAQQERFTALTAERRAALVDFAQKLQQFVNKSRPVRRAHEAGTTPTEVRAAAFEDAWTDLTLSRSVIETLLPHRILGDALRSTKNALADYRDALTAVIEDPSLRNPGDIDILVRRVMIEKRYLVNVAAQILAGEEFSDDADPGYVAFAKESRRAEIERLTED